MHIFPSSIKLVTTVALSALLVNALRRERPRRDDTDHSVQLALTGTADIGWLNANGENIDATEQKFQAFSPVTLTARPGEGTDWQVDGWDVGGIVRARPSYNDRAEWLQEVKDSLTRIDVTVIAAGRDDETPPGWWILISENRETELHEIPAV